MKSEENLRFLYYMLKVDEKSEVVLKYFGAVVHAYFNKFLKLKNT